MRAIVTCIRNYIKLKKYVQPHKKVKFALEDLILTIFFLQNRASKEAKILQSCILVKLTLERLLKMLTKVIAKCCYYETCLKILHIQHKYKQHLALYEVKFFKLILSLGKTNPGIIG